MTQAVPMSDGWLAFYRGANNSWTLVRDALGHPITCETAGLAQSVARYRRRRLKLWR